MTAAARITAPLPVFPVIPCVLAYYVVRQILRFCVYDVYMLSSRHVGVRYELATMSLYVSV